MGAGNARASLAEVWIKCPSLKQSLWDMRRWNGHPPYLVTQVDPWASGMQTWSRVQFLPSFLSQHLNSLPFAGMILVQALSHHLTFKFLPLWFLLLFSQLVTSLFACQYIFLDSCSKYYKMLTVQSYLFNRMRKRRQNKQIVFPNFFLYINS